MNVIGGGGSGTAACATRDSVDASELAARKQIHPFGGLLLLCKSEEFEGSPARRPAVAAVEHAASPVVTSRVTTELLFRRHSQRVLRYCLRCLRRPADAEDALQQTFLQAHRALDRGVEPEAEAAWLLAIARNVCLTRSDALRRRSNAEVATDPDVIADVVGASPLREEISDEVQAALAALPERQRDALFLREWHELTYEEIARVLGTTEAAVETLVFRARRNMERSLEPLRRRRVADLAGLLGWVRTGFGSASAKLAVGAAAATVTAGTAVTVVVERAPAPRHLPTRTPAVAVAPVAAAPVQVSHARRVVHSAAPRVVHPSRPRRHVVAPEVRSTPTIPTSVASATANPAPVSAPPAVASTPATPPPNHPAPVEPAAPATAPVAQTTTTPATTEVAAATTTATSVVSQTASTAASTVDAAGAAVAAAVPAAAPVTTVVSDTVDKTAATVSQTVDAAASTVNKTVSKLLPGH